MSMLRTTALLLVLAAPPAAGVPSTQPALRRARPQPCGTPHHTWHVAAAPAPAAERASNFWTMVLAVIKNVVGAGIFALPASVAAGVGLLPALVMTAISGFISGWTFFVLGRASAETGSSTYADLWARTVGPESVGVIDKAVVFVAFGTCVQYTATLCSLLGQLLPPGVRPRWAVRVLLASLCMLPLATASELSDVGLSTLVGVAGVVYSMLFCLGRLLMGTYRSASTPPLGRGLLVTRSALSLLPFAGTLNTVFLAHLSVPRYWAELSSGSVADFAAVVRLGFGASVLASAVMMAVGYLTFGDAARGLLLDMCACAPPPTRILAPPHARPPERSPRAVGRTAGTRRPTSARS